MQNLAGLAPLFRIFCNQPELAVPADPAVAAVAGAAGSYALPVSAAHFILRVAMPGIYTLKQRVFIGDPRWTMTVGKRLLRGLCRAAGASPQPPGAGPQKERHAGTDGFF